MREALIALSAAAFVACNGSTPPPDIPDVEPTAESTDRRPRAGGSGPSIEAEVGALDAAKVKETFDAAMPALRACLNDGRERVELIGGDIEILLRIASDGAVKYGYARRSTFGDQATEACILDALAGRTWPKPQGGAEGETSQRFSIDAQGRPPVDLDASVLGSKASTLKSKLKACKGNTGTTGLSVTMYIDPDGHVIAAGGDSADELGRDVVACAIDAAKGLSFGSPGSWAGKVTVRVD